MRGADDALAIVADERSGRRAHAHVRGAGAPGRARGARAAAAGVAPGDRVAGIVANMPEAIIAALAAASIGAVWSSCSPDFGVQGVLDRFGQIEPVVLVSVDGYHYGGKCFDCLGKLTEVAEQLPSVRQVVVIPVAGRRSAGTRQVRRSSAGATWLGSSRRRRL